jgi:dimeric dUTPase (all-alpha-NTP-PPase superfamily)
VADHDLLKRMFEMQHDLQARLGTPMIGDDARRKRGGIRINSLADLNETDRAVIKKWHKEFSLALMMEASELMDWSPWKHWSSRLGNKAEITFLGPDHLREVHMEIVDCFHFLIDLALLYGFTAEDLFETFAEKNAINHRRQDGGSY